MKIESVRVGYLRTNCYLLKQEGKALIIDPGDEYEKIMDKVGNDEIVGVIITHAHPDHVGAIEYFDKKIIYNFSNLKEGMNIIEPFSFEVIDTPGHKSDSISIYFSKEKVMFTGDFIFRDSIGRTDFPTGSMEEMLKSIEKIKEYDKDITIYPGHGIPTTLGYEIKNNPYFN